MSEQSSPFYQQAKKWLETNSLEAVSPFLSSLSAQATDFFCQVGLPSSEDEDWKYLNLKPLTQNTFSPNTLIPQDLAQKISAYQIPDSLSLVFVNGKYQASFSSDLTGTSLQVDTIKELPSPLSAVPVTDGFVALNVAHLGSAFCLTLPKNHHEKKLIHLIHVVTSSSQNTYSQPALCLVLQDFSVAHVLESFVSDSENTQTHLTNSFAKIILKEGASLDITRWQNENHRTFHIGQTQITQHKNSQLYSFVCQTGGQISRHHLAVDLVEENTFSDVDGFYAVGQNQIIDNHTSIDHQKPHGTSGQFYKGILKENGRAIFNGKIFVRKDAQQVSSQQLNQNLLLSPQARIDTKPQLEIDADDVKCQHGATVGQLNPEELFYFQSRAISKEAAAQMMIEGFAQDVLVKIRNEKVREFLSKNLQNNFFCSLVNER